MKINAKCYYNNKTLEVVCFTNECEGDYVSKPTKEDDFNTYPILKGRLIELYDYVEIEYGLLHDVLNGTNHIIDIKTKTLKYEKSNIDDVENPSNDDITIASRVNVLEEENTRLLLDSIEKDTRIKQLENDIADLLLNMA